MIYDFLKGKAAEFLQQKIQRELRATSMYTIKAILHVEYTKVSWEKGYFTYRDNRDEYLMFAHLKRSKIEKYGNPKFHTTICEARQEYYGYVFANKMPVSIICSDTGQIHSNLYLLQCRNCIKELTIKFFSIIARGRQWHDYIFSMAENRKYTELDKLKDGYTVDWKQISWARREMDGYKCQNCEIDLSNYDDQFFLEVHHIDGNKTNNAKYNLKSLCVLCHSEIDDRHKNNYSSGRNLLKVKSFNQKFNLS